MINSNIDFKFSSIADVLGNSESYLIPAYQRPYSWTKDQTQQLLNDIGEFIDSNSNQNVNKVDEYFLGTIILCNDKGLNVVDGAQRLTTLTILVWEISKRLGKFRKEVDSISELYPIKDYFYNTFRDFDKLVWQQKDNASQNDKPKLVSEVTVKQNDKILHDLLTKGLDYVENHYKKSQALPNYKNNYKLIQEWVDKLFAELDSLFSGSTKEMLDSFTQGSYLNKISLIINSVKLAVISTKNEQQALKIFESINSTGLALNAVDLYKAKLYRRLVTAEERKEFNDAWTKMFQAQAEIAKKLTGNRKLDRVEPIDFIFTCYMFYWRAKFNVRGNPQVNHRDFFLEIRENEYCTKESIIDAEKIKPFRIIKDLNEIIGLCKLIWDASSESTIDWIPDNRIRVILNLVSYLGFDRLLYPIFCYHFKYFYNPLREYRETHPEEDSGKGSSYFANLNTQYNSKFYEFISQYLAEIVMLFNKKFSGEMVRSYVNNLIADIIEKENFKLEISLPPGQSEFIKSFEEVLDPKKQLLMDKKYLNYVALLESYMKDDAQSKLSNEVHNYNLTQVFLIKGFTPYNNKKFTVNGKGIDLDTTDINDVPELFFSTVGNKVVLEASEAKKYNKKNLDNKLRERIDILCKSKVESTKKLGEKLKAAIKSDAKMITDKELQAKFVAERTQELSKKLVDFVLTNLPEEKK